MAINVEQAMPVPVEVSPGVFRCRLPIPDKVLRATNAYLVVEGGEALLVDCGLNTPAAFEFFEAHLKEIGLGFRDIKTIVVTHAHPDHFGLADKLQELSGAVLLLHRVEIAQIQAWFGRRPQPSSEVPEWLRMHGVPGQMAAAVRAAAPSYLMGVTTGRPAPLTGGDTIGIGRRRFGVIWTPGHSKGHICLFERETGLLFTGDHVLPGISPHVSFFPQDPSNPLADFLESLRTVQRLEARTVLPGHFDAIHNLSERVQELVDHHEERMAEIFQALGEKGETAYATASRIPWSGGHRVWQELGAFEQQMALFEVLAHLELMRARGSVEREVQDGLVVYQRAAVRGTSVAP